MNNDFDFIKDRIENSGVNAPERMDESYVMEQLADKQPKITELQPKKKRNVGRIVALAASFVLVAGVATGVGIALHNKNAAIPAVSENTGLIQFSNYDQVHAAMKEISDRNMRYIGTGYDYSVNENAAAVADGSSKGTAAAPDSMSTGSSGGNFAGGRDDGFSDSHSETYKQVDGVDEADIIKTDGRYIYVVENNWDENGYSCAVSIFPAQPGVTDPILKIKPFSGEVTPATPATGDEATADEPSVVTATFFGDSAYINDIYVRDGRLVILGSDYHVDDPESYSYRTYTRAYVYDVADTANVKLLDSYSQSGECTSSRMIGDTLYLITCEYSNDAIPVCGRGSTPDEIPANCIYSVEDPSESTFLIVSAYNTLDYTAATESKAILGVAEDVYCNEQNLYITASEYNYSFWVYNDVAVDYEVKDGDVLAADDDAVTDDSDPVTYGDDGEDAADNKIKTKIFKVSLTDGITFTAYGEVEGYINNQYSLDEYNGYLRVAATTTNSDYEDTNSLYILDGSLNQVGSVTGFAETESIKAVRYVGDTAYVITYEQTDPLFVIDLSNPSAPQILGEVKISGFSTMLVPLDDSTILGLGVNTGEYDYTDMEVQDGFKLALFDVSDKSNPQVLDSKGYVNYSSAVMWNPKALVCNPDRGDYIVPLSYYHFDDEEFDGDDWTYEEWDRWYDEHTEQYGAVLNFRIENGRIVETMLYRTDHKEIDRCVFVGDTIYMTYYDDAGVHLDSVSYP